MVHIITLWCQKNKPGFFGPLLEKGFVRQKEQTNMLHVIISLMLEGPNIDTKLCFYFTFMFLDSPEVHRLLAYLLPPFAIPHFSR